MSCLGCRAALQYGVLLHDQGQVPAAISCYQKAIQLDPENCPAYNNLGCALQELGQFEAALNCFRKALEIDGLNPLALQNLAALTLRQGRFKLALECLRRALLLNPQDPTARRLVAEVMSRAQRGTVYPLLPGGLVQREGRERRGLGGPRRRDEEMMEDEEEAGEEVAEDAAPAPEEPQQYLSWNDLLQDAWRRREALQKEQEQEQAAVAREEQQRLEQEREAARQRAEQMEQQIRDLYFRRPSAPPQQQQPPQPEPQRQPVAQQATPFVEISPLRPAVQEPEPRVMQREEGRPEASAAVRSPPWEQPPTSRESPVIPQAEAGVEVESGPAPVVTADEEREALQRERLEAALHAWKQLKQAAWARSDERTKAVEALQERIRAEEEVGDEQASRGAFMSPGEESWCLAWAAEEESGSGGGEGERGAAAGAGGSHGSESRVGHGRGKQRLGRRRQMSSAPIQRVGLSTPRWRPVSRQGWPKLWRKGPRSSSAGSRSR
jgi:tetratricopeptide (TPR) repeat protein